MLKNIKLGPKLISIFLLVGVIPLLIVTYVLTERSSTALSSQAFGQLTSLRSVKKKQVDSYWTEKQNHMQTLLGVVDTNYQAALGKLNSIQELKCAWIESYFKGVNEDIAILSTSNDISRALFSFISYGMNQGVDPQAAFPVDSRAYQSIRNRVAAPLTEFSRHRGYSDLFLIDAQNGHVLFSVENEPDLGTSLLTGPHRDEGLSRLYRQVIKSEKPSISDFAPYTPSNGAQTAFMGAPIRNADGDIAGVVALQIPHGAINAIVQKQSGMGNTGETYLVGRKGDETSFRSDMLTMGDGAYVIGAPIDTPYIRSIMEGQSERNIYTDSNGNLVMVAADPLSIPGLTWGCITKINLEEAITPRTEEGNDDFYARFTKEYGYYDLFLIHPKGHIFYSVTHEADFDTNILTGPYADSGLGRLTRKVIDESRFAMEDFSPYAPSNNEPAGFIAQPVVHDGKVEMVVALQLSIDRLNSIMQQKEGLGQSGETYLVGRDYLMRSDSRLAPETHSVKASFENPIQGRVKTEAVTQALSGNSDTRIIEDYNGNPVLSAWTPVSLGDITWTIIAEMDESEALAAVTGMKRMALLIAAVATGLVVLAGTLLARSIARPVAGAASYAETLAAGDFSTALEIDRNDEVGHLIQGLNGTSESLRTMIGQVIDGVGVLQTTATTLAEISDETTRDAASTNDKSSTVAGAAEELSTSLSQVAAAMEQSTANIGSVATATEQLNSTITEVARRSEEARSTSDDAVARAKSSSVRIGDLATAADNISQVTDVIAEISEQINLLALNATIEAARAGESGKGFAVVANEIKDLASQTAGATQQIKERIDEVQGSSSATIAEIQGVTRVIETIHETVGSIATAIEEQSIATGEIAENINQASQGIDEVNEGIAGSSQAAEEITRDIAGVHSAAGNIDAGSRTTRKRVSDLETLTAELTRMTAPFKIS
ncbi:methyl-accepting chemotaxis protein [Desulfoluna spongiiphila]|uniref:Methyl-accepting chemotaxis protein n=1 Tax=Desulfoluna spongiiphila TaxID=419481 RepID=A0A1G5EIF4_9BACT|nr:methyl-accepting chemotaxis protein [Desulfoluna spongiiphila]SCY26803.1 methyl-accepting chemotaxis protein [Desulfoluna spongiiphila]